MSNLRRVNLNLLPILLELLRRKSVTRAAEALHMSQSAVSGSLAQLRHIFDDELLVQVGREMTPTAFAETLLPRLEQTMTQMGGLIEPVTFDPQMLKRRFLVATADYVTLTLGGRLLRKIESDSPLSSIQFVDLQQDTDTLLAQGKIDLVILPQGLWPRRGTRFESLWEESFVYVARKDHPLLSQAMTMAQYETLNHIAYRPNQFVEQSVETRFMNDDAKTKFDVMRMPQFALLPFLVAQSDDVALVQRRLAELLAKMLDIQLIEPPKPVPKANICMFWTDVQENDPAHRWFRGMMRESANAS